MLLIRMYLWASFRFYSKDQPYYELSGSVLTLLTYVQISIRVNKKRMGRMCAPLYIVNKENIETNG